MSEIFDFSEFLDKADGDYDTGLTRTGWMSGGHIFPETIPVIIVIRKHHLYGFRLPSGELLISPPEQSEPIDLPPFPPSLS